MYDGQFNATKEWIRDAIFDFFRIVDLGGNLEPRILWTPDENDPQQGSIYWIWEPVHTPPFGGITWVQPGDLQAIEKWASEQPQLNDVPPKFCAKKARF